MELIDLNSTPAHVHSKAIAAVAEFLKQNDLNQFENGSHEIDGEHFFVNIFNYTTEAAEARIWEAHRKYIDVQLVLEGEEYIRQAFLDDVEAGEYEDNRDYLPITPPATYQTQFLLNGARLAVFYPNDAHQTGIKTTEHGQPVRKAVFKLAMP